MKSHNNPPAGSDIGRSNPYFNFDETWKMRDNAFDARAIIVNEKFWNRLRGELLDLLKDQGPLILYHIGASYGFEIGAKAREAEKDVASATKFLQYYFLLAGWGRMEISGAPDVGTMEVRVRDNFFAKAAESNTGNPSCFFLSGMLAGIAESLFEESYNCIEDRCMSSGSEACEFIIKRTASPSSR